MNEIENAQLKTMSKKEFRECMLHNFEKNSAIDKIADSYEKIPNTIKLIKNIDPTGVLGSIDDILSTNKANRQQIMIIDALYYIIMNLGELKQNINELSKYNPEEFSLLTEEYLSNSKECYQPEKVRYFANIWINGIRDREKSFDEKKYISTIIASISLEQIDVLVYLYNKVKEDSTGGKIDFDSPRTVPSGICQFAEDNNLEYAYVQQICIHLVGKGLLKNGAESAFSGTPKYFIPTNYVNTIIKYIMEYQK